MRQLEFEGKRRGREGKKREEGQSGCTQKGSPAPNFHHLAPLSQPLQLLFHLPTGKSEPSSASSVTTDVSIGHISHATVLCRLLTKFTRQVKRLTWNRHVHFADGRNTPKVPSEKKQHLPKVLKASPRAITQFDMIQRHCSFNSTRQN